MNNVLTQQGGNVLKLFRRWFVRNFAGTEPALCHMTAVVVALVGGISLAAIFCPEPVGYGVSIATVFALVELAFYLAKKLLRRLLSHGLGWLMALIALSYAVAYTVRRGSGEGWNWRVYLFSGIVIAVLWMLAAAWYKLLANRVLTPTTLCSALLSTVATALLSVFLFTNGFDNHYVTDYLALSTVEPAWQAALDPSLSTGPFTVELVDYGPGGSLESDTVDLTQYMSRGDEKLTAYYVDSYWDYDLNMVPLQGRVWYPAEETNCPVLFIAHGNHNIATESYLGYDYLGEYLASHGYVVVSVDHNACNMLSNENDGRAVLLLEHISLLLEYNKEKENPLYGRIDEENIAIAGHSRGGEMVATAYLFNGYDYYPEDGTIKFDYNYHIKSIIAIAPTVNQYKPADHSVKLEDVNYLLLHGAADRDVTNFSGMSQYENITFTGEGDYIKSALYIAEANHGQFNSLWGQYDQSGPFTALFNPASLISETEQQWIAGVFVKVFLDVTLRGDVSCRTLLTDWDNYAAQLPKTVYAQCYETSSFTTLADFEEDSDLETAAMEGVTASAKGFDWWMEELLDFAEKTAYDTHSLRLSWRRAASYSLSLPGLDMTEKAVCFDICDLNEEAVESGDLSLVDGTVVLTDRNGNTATAQLSDFAVVYPVLPVRTDKLDFIFNTCTYKKAFSTVSIPVAAFETEGEAFDAASVTALTLSFDGSGQVAIDNVGVA